MPYLPSDNKYNNSMVDKTNLEPLREVEPPRPANPLPKPEPKDGSVLKGRSRISVYELEGLLEGKWGKHNLRKEIASKFGYSNPWDPRVKAIVEQMKEKIPARVRADGYISHEEMKRVFDVRHDGLSKYWEERHDVIEKAAGGFTRKETKAIRRSGKVNTFLKGLFGIK